MTFSVKILNRIFIFCYNDMHLCFAFLMPCWLYVLWVRLLFMSGTKVETMCVMSQVPSFRGNSRSIWETHIGFLAPGESFSEMCATLHTWSRKRMPTSYGNAKGEAAEALYVVLWTFTGCHCSTFARHAPLQSCLTSCTTKSLLSPFNMSSYCFFFDL